MDLSSSGNGKKRALLKPEIQISIQTFAGVYSSGATPVPIPNTEVKPACGDGIAGQSLWESSTTPAPFLTRSWKQDRVFFCPEFWELRAQLREGRHAAFLWRRDVSVMFRADRSLLVDC